MDFLAQHIEALIFCAPKPLTKLDIQGCLKEMFDAEIPLEDVTLGINNIYQRYKSAVSYTHLTLPTKRIV